MALVRAKCDCYIDQVRRQGEKFEYDGPKNPNLEPAKPAKGADEPETEDKQDK